MRRLVTLLGLILALVLVVSAYGPQSVSVSAATRAHSAVAKKTCMVGKRRGQRKQVCLTLRLKRPNAYYLALGDSITAGVRLSGPTNPRGLANQFFSTLRSHGINHLLNLACAAETSSSFVNGPCPIPPSVSGHFGGYPASGSQLHAALAFIHGHPRQVKYVTINLGGNDFQRPDISGGGCSWHDNQFSHEVARFDTTFRSILTKIKAALGAGGVLLTMNAYDAFATFCAKVPAALAVIPTFNKHVDADASTHGVPVANLFTAFGGPAAPNPKLCTLTYMCQSSPDFHPSTAGHALIARVLKATAGL
jgi:lysophospholipase L1-like esterase